MIICDQKKSILCCIADQSPAPHPRHRPLHPPLPTPPKVCNGVRQRGASDEQLLGSLARRHGGSGGDARALVPLFGVLLTVHHVAHPKVASHAEVEATVRAGVALRVAEVVVRDAYGHRAA